MKTQNLFQILVINQRCKCKGKQRSVFLCTLLNISTDQTSTLSVKTSPLEVDIMSLTMFEITNIIYNHSVEFTDNNFEHQMKI